jgi:hypothetical protein
MAGVSASLETIALQKSGRYVTWATLTASATGTMPGEGTVGIAVDVSGIQLAKLVVSSSNCTLAFHTQYKFEGLDGFHRVDQSERSAVTYNWTQQADVSGVDYIYVCVSSYSGAGSYTISIGKAVGAP